MCRCDTHRKGGAERCRYYKRPPQSITVQQIAMDPEILTEHIVRIYVLGLVAYFTALMATNYRGEELPKPFAWFGVFLAFWPVLYLDVINLFGG